MFLGCFILIGQILSQQRSTLISQVTPSPSMADVIRHSPPTSSSGSLATSHQAQGDIFCSPRIIHVRPRKADSESSLPLNRKLPGSSNRKFGSQDSNLTVLSFRRPAGSLNHSRTTLNSEDGHSIKAFTTPRTPRTPRAPRIFPPDSSPPPRRASKESGGSSPQSSRTPPLQRSRRLDSQDSWPSGLPNRRTTLQPTVGKNATFLFIVQSLIPPTTM